MLYCQALEINNLHAVSQVKQLPVFLHPNRPQRALGAACWKDNAEGCQSTLCKLQQKVPSQVSLG